MTRHYSSLKSSMDHFRAAQADRLKTLSLNSNSALDEVRPGRWAGPARVGRLL